MSDVYLYADETGNLDYAGGGKAGASPYFGFGTAVFDRDHGSELWEGLKPRAELERRGLNLPQGFHAVNDSSATRTQMFEEITRQRPRIDTTFLCKENAYDYVKARGQMHLYKMAWYLHFKYVAEQVAEPGDTLYVIAGSFGTRERQAQARLALEDVCNQISRTIVLCIWSCASSWGLQVADYALWAVHRQLMGKPTYWYTSAIEPNLKTTFTPWGRPASA